MVGKAGTAAQAAGINVHRYRTLAFVAAGILCGLAGAHLSLGYVTLFSENMTNGRGYSAFVAVIFVKADPGSVLIASLVFSLADTLSTLIQGNGIPSSLVLMLPYIVTILALVLRSRMTRRKHRGIIKKQIDSGKKASTSESGKPGHSRGHRCYIYKIRRYLYNQIKDTVDGTFDYGVIVCSLENGRSKLQTYEDFGSDGVASEEVTAKYKQARANADQTVQDIEDG